MFDEDLGREKAVKMYHTMRLIRASEESAVSYLKKGLVI